MLTMTQFVNLYAGFLRTVFLLGGLFLNAYLNNYKYFNTSPNRHKNATGGKRITNISAIPYYYWVVE